MAGAPVTDKVLTEECLHMRREGRHGRKILSDDGDVAQKLWRGFQLPVGRVDVCVTAIGIDVRGPAFQIPSR
jgi:hypothetical protein